MKKIWIVTILLLSNFLFSETIELWYRWNKEESVSLIKNISKFEAITGNKVILKNFDYKILTGKFISATKTGNGPDLVITSSSKLTSFLSEDLLAPIDSYVNKNKRNQFIQSTLKDAFLNKKMYGLPITYKLLALIYNKDMIKVPPKNTKELIEIGLKFTNMDKGKYGLAYPVEEYYYQIPWITGFGGKIVEDGKVFFNSTEHKNAINFTRSLQLGKNAIMPEGINYDLMLSLFTEGQIPMIINGTWITGDLLKSGINIGVTKIPTVSETGIDPQPFVSSELIMMSQKSKNPKIAYALMHFLTSENAQMENSKAGHLPTIRSVYKLDSFKNGATFDILEGFRKQAEVAISQPRVDIMNAVVWKIGGSILKNVLYDTEPVENRMERFQIEAETMIKALNNE